ncbi:MAG: GTPase HflX [Rickettsiales bacterium]|nr:GTPase HflX [Rickettsiales bacterium]
MKAVSIGIDYNKKNALWTHSESLLELNELAKTSNIDIIHSFSQQREKPDFTSYFGKGKIEEVKHFCKENEIKCLLIDDDITPAQSKFLEKDMNVKILDRTGLILDIFAQRAQTYEAQLQVEMAQLNYLLPRLTRLWTHLSRLGGGIGTRGPGEKQLEVDKRQITKRLGFIKKKLSKVKQDREIRRRSRSKLPLLAGAIVGYTNAGKSTLLNTLTNASVLSEDKLFATLDPTSRKLTLPSKMNLVLTDTVGFIQKLPHHLVKAFYSTLEEVTEADFIIHVIDASSPTIEGCIKTSLDIITRLDAADKPILYLFNKWDRVRKPNAIAKLIEDFKPQLKVSLRYSFNQDDFYNEIDKLLENFNKKMRFFIPYNRMDIVNLLHSHSTVHSEVYEKEIEIEVTINSILGDKIMAMLY